MSPALRALAARPRLLLALGALLVILGQIVFVRSEAETPPGGGVFLLALGWALFALGSFARGGGEEETRTDVAPAAPESDESENGGKDRRVMAAGLGVVTLSMTLTRLAFGADTGWDVLPWLFSLAAVGTLFLPRLMLPALMRVRVKERAAELRAFLLAPVRAYWIDAAVVIVLMGVFIGVNAHDLASWRYSVIGDEYAFFFGASEILDGGLTRPFNQNGVYDRHPVMDIAYQASVMRVFGGDHVSWVLSSVLAAALAIPGVYLLGYLMGGRKAAAVSAVFFSSSHYLFAFTHLGYNTLHALPIIVWALAFFVLGLRRGNPLWLYLAGVVAGVGLYTIFSARILIPVMLAFLVLSPERLALLRRSWPVGLGFAMAGLPALIVNRGELFSRMLDTTTAAYNETGGRVAHILTTLEVNALAFNFSPRISHFVSGSLFDAVTAVLAVLGIAFALGRFSRPSSRLLLVWLLAAVITSGALSPYPYVAVTRLHPVILPLVLLAGLLTARLLEAVPPLLARYEWGPRFRTGVIAASITALAVTVLTLNAVRFWSTTPEVFHHHRAAVAVGAWRSGACGAVVDGAVFVGRDAGLVQAVIASYDPGAPLPRFLAPEEVESAASLDGVPLRCVVFIDPEDPRTPPLAEDLGRLYPDGRLSTFSDPAEKSSVAVFARGAG